MKLLNPLSGFKVASQIAFLQFAFILAMSVPLLKKEFKLNDINQSVGIMFIAHILCAFLEYFRYILETMGRSIRMITFLMNFANTIIY
jgi:hypothetical protein